MREDTRESVGNKGRNLVAVLAVAVAHACEPDTGAVRKVRLDKVRVLVRLLRLLCHIALVGPYRVSLDHVLHLLPLIFRHSTASEDATTDEQQEDSMLLLRGRGLEIAGWRNERIFVRESTMVLDLLESFGSQDCSRRFSLALLVRWALAAGPPAGSPERRNSAELFRPRRRPQRFGPGTPQTGCRFFISILCLNICICRIRRLFIPCYIRCMYHNMI